MQLIRGFLLIGILGFLLSACSGKQVRPVYKPGATNVFETECPVEQACFKNAREHCEGDFEVIKKGTRALKQEDDETDAEELDTLEFRCI